MDGVQVSDEMVGWLKERIEQYGNATMPDFAEMFKFSDRRDADRAFSLLISKSFLRKSTRHTLQSSYDVWKRNEGDQFWVSLEAKTQVATDLVVGSVPKARKLALGDSYQTRAKSNMQVAPTTNADKIPATPPYLVSNESSVRSQRASHIAFDVEESAVECEHYQDTTVRRSIDVAVGNKRRQALLEVSQQHEQPRQKRRSEQQQQQKRGQQHAQQKEEEDLSRQNFFDPSTIDPCELEIESVDVGKPFRQLQEEAADVVNDIKKTMTLELQPLFFAANHIWDVTYRLPGMSDEDHDTIQHALRVPIARLSDHHLLFCRDLERDLTSAGYIKSRDTKSRDLDALLVLYQQASQKLPKRFLSFKHLKNEDTHAHSVLDALLTLVFPSTSHRYELHWANRPTAGSCDRRNGDAYKPDATVLKDGFELAFMEVKPPKEERHQRPYLEDVWALSGLAKDNIDLHLRHSRILATASCIQVFGYQMTLYKLSFQTGIYVWQNVHTSHLPKDHYDICNLASCVELLKTFKTILDEVCTERYVRTPTKRVETDEELPDLYRPRPTNISPSTRPFFHQARRTSV